MSKVVLLKNYHLRPNLIIMTHQESNNHNRNLYPHADSPKDCRQFYSRFGSIFNTCVLYFTQWVSPHKKCPLSIEIEWYSMYLTFRILDNFGKENLKTAKIKGVLERVTNWTFIRLSGLSVNSRLQLNVQSREDFDSYYLQFCKTDLTFCHL